MLNNVFNHVTKKKEDGEARMMTGGRKQSGEKMVSSETCMNFYHQNQRYLDDMKIWLKSWGIDFSDFSTP